MKYNKLEQLLKKKALALKPYTTIKIEFPKIIISSNIQKFNNEYNQFMVFIQNNRNLAQIFITKKKQETLDLLIDLYVKSIIIINGQLFELLETQEINSLITRNIFEFIKYNPFVCTGKLFNFRLINKKKHTMNILYEKSQFVI